MPVLGITADAYTAPVFATEPPLVGLALWLDATDPSTFTYSSANNVSQWRDKSGNGNHGNSTTYGRRNHFLINGHDAVYFTGGQCMNLDAGFASLFTSAELFMVIELVTENLGGTNWRWGEGSYTHYPYSDGTIYESWGATTRRNLPNPTPSLLDPHVYNLRTAPGSYVAEINGLPLFASASNTVLFQAGGSQLPQGNPWPADLLLGEVLMYNRVLDAGDRDQAESYLSNKWGTP